MPLSAALHVTARPVRIVVFSGLMLLALGQPLFYSRFGLMALDQSIVFDGGWRILSGQRPFVDFVTPVGITPSLMQAGFFGLFGVSWFAYALHAAVVNALFAAVAFAVMRDLGAGFWPAWFVGLSSAVTFYPPVAVPYLDQHSFFFSLCCFWAAVRIAAGRPGARWAVIAAPAVGVLAYLSKQIPAAFLAVPALAFVVVAGWRKARGPVLVGLALPVVALTAYAVRAHVSAEEAIYYLVELPLSAGTGRVELWSRVERVWPRWLAGVPSTATTVMLSLWAGVAVTWLASIAASHPAEGRSRPIILASLSLALTAVTAAFVINTINEVTNGLPLLGLAVGMAWLAGDLSATRILGGGRASRVLRGALASAVIAASLVDLWRFDSTVNLGRHVHGGVSWNEPRWSPEPPLDFLRLTEADAWLGTLLAYIRRRNEHFLLFGDASILYGATGHPSIFPALYLHPGMTIPPERTEEFERFQQRLLDRMRTQEVRYVLEQPGPTWAGARLESFPRVTSLLAGCPRVAADGWHIIELCHRP